MKYTEHYDEDSGYCFEIPELVPEPGLDLEEFLQGNGPEIMAALLSAVYNGIELSCEQVPVFAVAGADTVVSITRDQYPEKLHSLLDYFSRLEEYEICETLVELEKKINNKV